MTLLDKLKKEYDIDKEFEKANELKLEFLKEFQSIYESNSVEYIKKLMEFNREFLMTKS
jgi:hypothetical protein